MACVDVPDGILVTAKTSGLLRVARFVVGLGAAATVQTPELRHLVEELARGAFTSLTSGADVQ
jgi:hypothetical protein